MHSRMRAFDRDLIRGGHYGQRSCEPHLKAEHTAARPTLRREESSCQLGAVHTRGEAELGRAAEPAASVENDRAARLAAIPAGESPRQQRSPVAVVVISSNGEGDRSVESLEVKVPEGWAFQSDPHRGASNLAGCSGSEPVKPRNLPPARNGLRECRECRAGGHSAKANVGIEYLDSRCRTPRGRRGRHARKE